MMHRYEALILSVPTITQDEAKNLEDQFSQLAEKYKVDILSFDRWGKYRLAYPVAKNEYGIYYLSRFESEAPQGFLDDIKVLFAVKLNDIVMRYLVNKLDAAASLEYERPQSLEELPARDKDSTLNKASIEKILTTADNSKAERKQEAEVVVEATEEAEPADVAEQEEEATMAELAESTDTDAQEDIQE